MKAKRRKKAPQEHTYLMRLLDLHQEGKIPAGSWHHVDVYHDDWCGIYRGDFCDCNPDIRLTRMAQG